MHGLHLLVALDVRQLRVGADGSSLLLPLCQDRLYPRLLVRRKIKLPAHAQRGFVRVGLVVVWHGLCGRCLCHRCGCRCKKKCCGQQNGFHGSLPESLASESYAVINTGRKRRCAQLSTQSRFALLLQELQRSLADCQRLLHTVHVTTPTLRTCLAVALLCGTAAAQRRTILRAYAGSDGRAHIVLQDGGEYVAPKEGSGADEDQQQAVADMQVSEDGRAAGWLVLYPNCCTSYPIALEWVVYRDGKLRSGMPLTVERSISRWHFWRGSSQVVLLYESLHGRPDFEAQLFDPTSSKRLAVWSEPPQPAKRLVVPPWLKAFRRYMEESFQR